MNELFSQALSAMETAFRRMEEQVPPPQAVPYGKAFVFRYVEQSIQQALIQKLARLISGLYAADVLLENGFVQEQGLIHRTLDELGEDIEFLAAALTNDTVTDLHKQYLQSFYAEDFDDPDNPVSTIRGRHMVPRRKIRAYLTRAFGKGVNPSREIAVSQAISKIYSGFVHAASPHIMALYGGDPPRFHLCGMLGTPRVQEHRHDSWNYFFRALLSTTVVAKAFGDQPLVEGLNSFISKFEELSGTNYRRGTKGET